MKMVSIFPIENLVSMVSMLSMVSIIFGDLIFSQGSGKTGGKKARKSDHHQCLSRKEIYDILYDILVYPQKMLFTGQHDHQPDYIFGGWL